MKLLFTAFLIATAAPAAFAQATVRDPWVRATVPQQKATGAVMRITSPQDARLVAASSPIAGAVEFHQMAMEKDVMKMRAVRAIALPAGKTVELKAGGYHVMLLELKRQVKEGETVFLIPPNKAARP